MVSKMTEPFPSRANEFTVLLELGQLQPIGQSELEDISRADPGEPRQRQSGQAIRGRATGA